MANSTSDPSLTAEICHHYQILCWLRFTSRIAWMKDRLPTEYVSLLIAQHSVQRSQGAARFGPQCRPICFQALLPSARPCAAAWSARVAPHHYGNLNNLPSQFLESLLRPVSISGNRSRASEDTPLPTLNSAAVDSVSAPAGPVPGCPG